MANKEAKKENSKNKKSFFKDFKAELKRVNWPTPKQLLNNTTAVITIVIITAVIVFVLDVVFETLNKHGVDKIKDVIATNNTSVNDTTENTTNSTEAEVENETTPVEENTEASNEVNETLTQNNNIE